MDLMAVEVAAATTDANGRLVINATATVYTQSFMLPRATSMGVEYRLYSGGTIDVDVSIEVGNVRPTTEGSADTENYGVATAIETGVNDQVLHVKAPAPTVNKYARFKLQGQGSNAATTAIEVLMFHWENN